MQKLISNKRRITAAKKIMRTVGISDDQVLALLITPSFSSNLEVLVYIIRLTTAGSLPIQLVTPFSM